ncbi:WecB/TagA/CpsF family glycosyltransferase [Nesterenkonia jeotgali]|uniref:WecB/TagA/CpsF family glycosyltransferase n=1 Tax=Nesterenkonia jeotgali TaxID=317018 RepID=UPI0009FB8902|nr:WecB/TagA/CpsF family glycosyltransferase [Nesterenkonia jeotgali]
MKRHLQETRLVGVGPFTVQDHPAREVARRIGELVAVGERTVAYALHVGGLNHRNNEEFVQALDDADIVYADGAAVVTLARLAGAAQITRAATTDIGVEVIQRASITLGRTCRLALVGGGEGLASEAGARLQGSADCEVVLAEHGYHSDDLHLVEKINSVRPDIVIVGLGMPREALWVKANWETLPESLIMTCGGWFGFLAGHEQRAPRIMQSTGTEWAFRLAQAPRHLAARYANGLISTVRLAPSQFKQKGKHVRSN